MGFAVVLIGVLLLIAFLGVAPGLIVAAVGLALLYWISVQLNPRVAHRGCGGSGRSRGWLFTWSHHRCQGCGGSGRMIRYGAARWGNQAIRDEADARRRAKDDARQARSWR